MILRFKRLDRYAILPRYATSGSGCLDLYAKEPVDHINLYTARFGWAVEIPSGHVMLIFSRSGHGFRHGIHLVNCVGVIDSDYRGEVMVRFHPGKHRDFCFTAGEAVAQALVVPIPELEPEWADELSDTYRGTGGFGSTDQKVI